MEIAFGGWISTYSKYDGEMNISESALICSMYWLFITIGRLLAIPLSVKLNSK